jgi:monovalent cation/hydrogen antiporter
MHTHFIEFIFLVLIILALIMIANKLKVAYPIILVLGGLALSFTSVFSHVTIDPGMVFYIFLPPLLYLAAWQTSWKEFWKWRRVITIFAFPMVIITSLVIAYFSTALIPDSLWPWDSCWAESFLHPMPFPPLPLCDR